jgi:hypothetical protein
MNAYTTTIDYLNPIIWALVIFGSMYFAGRIAERRGRSFKTWAVIAGAFLGPLALPLLFLLPNLRRRDTGGPEGEKRPADVAKPLVQDDPNPSRLSFAEAT